MHGALWNREIAAAASPLLFPTATHLGCAACVLYCAREGGQRKTLSLLPSRAAPGGQCHPWGLQQGTLTWEWQKRVNFTLLHTGFSTHSPLICSKAWYSRGGARLGIARPLPLWHFGFRATEKVGDS